VCERSLYPWDGAGTLPNLLCGFHLSTIIGTDELTLSGISFGGLVIAASHRPSLAEAVWPS
jgi:hypothetical protein